MGYFLRLLHCLGQTNIIGWSLRWKGFPVHILLVFDHPENMAASILNRKDAGQFSRHRFGFRIDAGMFTGHVS